MDVLASAHREKMGRVLADYLKHVNGNAQENRNSGQGAGPALRFSLHGRGKLEPTLLRTSR